MLNREQALDEARRQKEALEQIGGWRRFLFLLTALLLGVAVLGIKTGGAFFPAGIAAAVAAAVSFVLTCIVDLSIRNGRRNVEKILDSLK